MTNLAIINVGTNPNDKTGDTIRAAMQKVNANVAAIQTTQALGDNSNNVATTAFVSSAVAAVSGGGGTKSIDYFSATYFGAA